MKTSGYTFRLLMVILFHSYVSRGQQSNSELENLKNKPINSEFCGTDFFHNEKMENDQAYKKRHLKSIADIKKLSTQTYKKAAGGITQIPVVVHVMHKGETVGSGTNISDEDVKKGLRHLNNYWRKIVGTQGFGDGVDMKVEFSLAIQDPNGNCTTGIDRVNMSGVPAYVNNGVNRSGSNGIPDYQAGGAINSLKEYSIWNPTQYYNVWIVDEIDNENCYSNDGSYTSGYAYYSSSHGQQYDGSVVLICSYLSESSSTWAHEMGHAFNLQHTFNGDDSNNDGIGDQCGDDGIADTPKHIRTSSISPSIYSSCSSNIANECDPLFNMEINPETGFRRNSGTVQDHMHNYMDYTGCRTEFTGGQRTVVSAALIANRASFLTSPALTPVSPATVYFTSSSTNTCLGGTINFYDESSCTPNTYTNAIYDNVSFLWTFDNKVNPPIMSTLQNPVITFTNIGVYDVTLAVTNPQGTTSLIKQQNIAVTAGVVAACSISSSSKNGNFGIGVTKVSFNSLTNITTTFIPTSALNYFSCSKSTTVFVGNSYPLTVNYQSRAGGNAYLEVWIDWDNSGTFQLSNNNGINELVLTNTIPASSFGSPSVNIIPPVNAVLNTMLRVRVVTEHSKSPTVCGAGSMQRADDYGVYVKAACSPPTATLVNNSSTTVLTCVAPSISLTASGGVSYFWNNNKGITPTIAVTEPGNYTVTVTSADGCTATESIVITENKPAPTAMITNNTGFSAITCTISTISVTASGGVSYSWDSGLGSNASASITEAGTYTVTVTAANGCTASKSIVITDEKTTPACSISSTNNNRNYGCGVTNVKLNTLDKTTTTFIPALAMQNFICTDNTTLVVGSAYNLDVTYKSRSDGSQFLEVWIDWDNNGIFQTSNSNGVNERVLTDNIATFSTTKTAIASIIPPANATLNTLLRMRVISEYKGAPAVCGSGLVKRADDYGVIVNTPTIWNGIAWSSGVPTATVEAIIDANYNTNIGGSQIPFSTKKLTVNAGKSLTVNAGTTITIQNEVVNNGVLTIENNANLIQVNNVVNTGIGTTIVKRNSNSLKRLDYTMWSSPVTGQNLFNFSNLTSAAFPIRFYTYDPTNNVYVTINPLTNSFAQGTGYLIRMPNVNPADQSLTTPYYLGTPTTGLLTYNGVFTGTLNNGTISLSNLISGKFYSIGNPYPSTISADAFLSGNSTGGTLYFWRKTNGTGGSAYATYTAAGGAGTGAGSSVSAPNGTIQVGQGFIVKTAGTSLSFTNAMRTSNTENQFFKTKKAADKSRFWLNLSNTTGAFSQAMIAYMDGATLGVDLAFDGKYFNDSKIALTSNIAGEEYTIQGRPAFDATDVVPLNFKTDVAGDYSIGLDSFDGLFLGNQNIFLKDNQLGLIQNLKENSHSFTSAAGTFNTRFEIVYKNDATLNLENPKFSNDTVFVFQKDKSIYIDSSNMEMKNIIIYDILGRKILEKLDINKTSIKINLKVNQQILILKITNKNNQIVTKKIVY